MHNRGFDPSKKFDKNTFSRLLKYMAKYKWLYLVVVIFIIISSIVQVYAQLMLKSLIDDYITPLIGNSNPDYIPLLHFLFGVALIYLIGLVSSFLYNRLMIRVSQGVLKNVRNDMFNHLETLPINYFDNNPYGDIMSKFTNDTDSLEQMISQSIPSVFGSLISTITVFISMLVLNVPLTLLVIVGIVLMIFVNKNVVKKSGENFIKQQNDLGNLNGFIEEMINGAKVIKVFTHEEETKKDFCVLNDELYNSSSIASGYGNMIAPISNNIGHIIYVIIALIGGLIAINTNTFTLGAIASFLALTNNFTRPIMQITFQFNSIVRALAGASRIFNLMDEIPEENDGKVTLVNVISEDELEETNEQTGFWAWKKDGELIPLKGDIRFNNVHFGYDKDKEIIHNVSFYAKPGQKIAFVGSTGAGKTTILNLLNRFYDIDSGNITYDGIDIKEINKIDLRKSLGMVLQDTNLFTGTILDNISYGRSDASKEECIEAAKMSNASHFIEMLPDGYDTKISANGNDLSQGQRQLLAIARSLVANPPVMILDEATSSIDTRTEKIVQDGMDKLMNNRTVLVIAHRLSTIQNAKAILVMEDGKIIERGSHDELLKLKGKYYELYTGVSELE